MLEPSAPRLDAAAALRWLVKHGNNSASTSSWSAQSAGLGASTVPLFPERIDGYAVNPRGSIDPEVSARMTYDRMDGVSDGVVESGSASLKQDEVAFDGGVVTMADFERMPPQDFGCMR